MKGEADNIFDSDCHAIVNTTNCQGVMGFGLAAQFRRRYPAMFLDYRRACAEGRHVIGRIHVYRTQFDVGHPGGPANRTRSVIINFPTMTFPGSKAELSDIEDGLLNLRKLLINQPDIPFTKIESIAIPPLGCGVGRLPWPAVEALIRKHLGDLSWLRVEVYPPNAPKYDLKDQPL